MAMAEAGPLSDFQQARLALVRAQLAFVTNRGSDAPPLLLQAARRLQPIDTRNLPGGPARWPSFPSPSTGGYARYCSPAS